MGYLSSRFFAWFLLLVAIGGYSATRVDGATTAGRITGIWANDGGDKVSQDELRLARGVENVTGTVKNSIWDGSTIHLFGAANESINFNLVLEAAGATAPSVSVSFDTLTGPNGAVIQTDRQATGDDVFNYVGRPIELFYVRYLQIEGLSTFGYFRGDERQIPARFRAPTGSPDWSNRPDHNKFYPDALIPFELVQTFAIAAQQNQSIWADIFIGKKQPPGLYTGTVTVRESGVVTHSIPVSLAVAPFALPDSPTYTAFTNVDPNDIQGRWFGQYTNWQSPGGALLRQVSDRYVQYMKRNRITPISAEQECAGLPIPSNLAHCGTVEISVEKRFTGELFTNANGYDGPGVGQGLSLYSDGTYGTWGNAGDEQSMWNIVDPIGQYFKTKFPNVEAVIYLEDEPPSYDFSKIETWAKWIAEDPGPGSYLKTLSTTNFSNGTMFMPDLDIPMDPTGIGECFSATSSYGCPNNDNYAFTNNVVSTLLAKPRHEAWMYNYNHPASGTSNTEDDGIAMRTFGWIQHKMNISHWFYWFANIDSQDIDLLAQACTWGCGTPPDSWYGMSSEHNFTNGNGNLVYPGTDNNPGHISYGVNGPFGSLRLKEWRRGIEDADYMAIAAQIDPVAVRNIVQTVIPKVLWEYPAPGGDTTYFYGDISWSSNPDMWESGRSQLAQIISGFCTSQGTAANTYCTAIPALAPAPVAPAPVNPTPISSAPVPPIPVQPVSITPINSATGPVPLHFMAMASCRVLDTRTRSQAPALARNETRVVNVVQAGCQIPATAKAYAMNVTVVPHGSLNYVTVWPTGAAQPLVSNLNSYDGRVKANAAIVPAGSNGTVSIFATDSTDIILDINGYFVDATNDTTGLAFYPVKPCRLFDTRSSPAGALASPFMAAGSQRTFPVRQSSCGIPSTAQAYSLNYTAVPHHGLSWMTAWATGIAMPLASVLNATTNTVTANAAITQAGTSGSITLYVNDDSDMIVDINGYFAPPVSGGMNYYAVSPCRAFDSRSATAPSPLLGTMSLNLANANCSIPTSASVVAINATTVPSTRLQYLTLWSFGKTQPTVSTLNALDGKVTSNLAIVPATNGAISAYLTDRSQLIFDVFGYFQ